MTVEAWLFAATSVVAGVAVVVAALALRTVRELKAAAAEPAPVATSSELVVQATPMDDVEARVTPPELAPRVLQGRVIVPPTQSQVVRTALGRPGVRLSVFAHGLARALRAENRDRIVALMRREYRHRRRERLRAGRQAVRMARPTSAPSTDRLHEHLLEPKPLTLTDRMLNP